jgi:hypothetical protein
MPRRRRHTRTELLAQDAQMELRWEIEVDIVKFAVRLQARVGDEWGNVVLFDCSHSGKNDRHRYSREGDKGPAENFHHGTASDAFRAAIDLIRADHERMIDEWRR